MRVVNIEDRVQDSLFYFGTKKKPPKRECMDYDTALSHIIKHEKLGYEEAVDYILDKYQIYKSAATVPNKGPVLPNKDSKQLFSFFKWHCNPDGTISEYVKTRKDEEVYVLTSDVINTSKVVYPFPNSEDSLFDRINNYYYELKSSNKLFLRSKSEEDEAVSMGAETVTKYWESVFRAYWLEDNSFRLKEQPKIISSDKKQACFFFFNPDIIKEGDTPNWDGWLTTMKDYMRPVFMAWIYSIFDAKNMGRQCLWLEDNGYTGKSSMSRAISSFMGNIGVGALSKDSLSNQFGYSNVYGKRFVIYGDNKNPRLLSSEKIHSVLGGDTVSIERKSKQAFTGRVHAKILVSSNCKPEVDMYARNEDSRIIHIKLSDPDKEVMKKYCATDKDGNIKYYPNGNPIFIGGNLEEELLDEMPAFLHKCQDFYKALCPNRKDIILPEKAIQDKEENCVSMEMEKFERFSDDCLEFGEDCWVQPYELLEEYKMFNNGKEVKPLEYAQVKRFLESMHHVKNGKVRHNGKSIRVLRGVKIQGEDQPEIGGVE